MSARILMVLVCALLLSACGTRGLLEAEEAAEPELAEDGPELETLWKARVGAAGDRHERLQPALEEGVIYTAAADGQVTALDAEDGERLWRTRLDAGLTGGVGVGEGLVTVASRKGRVFALDAEDGEERWEAQLTSEILAPPAVGQDSVVVRSNDGRIFALEAEDGSQRWLYDRNVPALSLRGHASPVLVRGGVVTGFDNGRLSALTLREGAPAWEATVGVPRGRTDLERMVDVDADPVVDGNDLFAASYQGRVTGIALNDGQIAWNRDISARGGLAVDDSNLYVTDDDGRIWAFDRRNGATVWRQDGLEGLDLTAPARHGDYLVVGGSDGHLTWLDPGSGEPVARYRVGDARIEAPPLVEGEVLYVQDLAGRLVALRPAE